MKRKPCFFFLGLFVFGTFLYAQSFDEAIIGAAVKISGDLPANATAAIINFRSDSEKLNDYVINELYGAILRNRRITPVKPDQNQIQTIRGDQGSNMADIVNKESAQRIGRLLGAQYLITGSMQHIGSAYKINLNAIDTNAEIKSMYSASLNPQNDSQLALLLGISTESNSASAYVKQQKIKQQDEIKNWVSFNSALSFGQTDLGNHFSSGFGLGINYEYMLNPKISVGTNIFLGLYDPDEPYYFKCYTLGIDASFRFYPWGKTFFIGTALGFHYIKGIANDYSIYGYYLIYNYYSTFHSFTFGITPEIGWKIDGHEKGGLYSQLGFAILYAIGKPVCDDPRWSEMGGRAYIEHISSYHENYLVYYRGYFGVGYAF